MKVKDAPDSLKPYLFHGLDLDWKEGEREATTECPWCGAEEGKFNINSENGLWKCFRCKEGLEGKEGGNSTDFIKLLWQKSTDATMVDAYSKLAKERGFVYPDTPVHWEACQSIITKRWLIPGFGIEGKMQQLYKWTSFSKKKRLLATPGLPHKLFGVNLYRKQSNTVYLCEGPWDAMALWELLRVAKAKNTTSKETDNIEEDRKTLVETADEDSSLLSSASVLSVPGCGTFHPSWCSLFAGKRVCILFDNDYPKKNPKTGKTIPPAGLNGVRRTASILSSHDDPPSELLFLRWGNAVEGWSSELPDGMDLRDRLAL